MDRQLKSLAYAFVSRDIEVYIPDGETDCLVINRLVCNECGEYWHTSMQECYFCGTLNLYLYECTDCSKKYSITNSSKRCDSPGCAGNLVKKCDNDSCLSNTNHELIEATFNSNGVFELGSSFSLSLMRCVSCSNSENTYKSFRIFVKVVDDTIQIKDILFIQEEMDIYGEDDILILKKNVGQEIHYAVLNKKEIDMLVDLPLFIRDFKMSVDELFPINHKQYELEKHDF